MCRSLIAALCGAAVITAQHRAPFPIAIDYPIDGTVFPPELTPPAFQWRDAADGATHWTIEVTFADGSPALRIQTSGDRMRIGDVDPRAIAETNELPRLSAQRAAARVWRPHPQTWDVIKRQSMKGPATVTISGLGGNELLSSGRISIRTSRDPVGAPIFYRDVPLMPTETEKGVIKPIIPSAQPLIAWRLRDIGKPASRLLMERLPTCANCHSFSRDGKTLGMDLDGPQNDKSMYAIAPLAPHTSIRDEDVIVWNTFPGMLPGRRTIAFMPQLSPDGQYATATLNEEVFVANFKDYRFLQVFYPTRGIVACYSRATGKIQALPGADDPSYVQTNAVWSPDGSYLVFSRAKATDPYPEGRKLAEYANDPNEPPIRYDLYRIPFNGGRGGKPEPIAGASRNGMSNSFPRVSPDGRWIVFVQSRNGQLMRPDGQLYIVPAEGGRARRMRCNTPLMNSWHSFSPNSRWMVFSSKGESPYTQMYLTHIDEKGNDTPAILIENATAANRAVNLPEFLNVPPGGLLDIEVPAAEFYRIVDRAWTLAQKGDPTAAIAEWRKALAMSPEDAKSHNNLGVLLTQSGLIDEAAAHYRAALEAKPAYVEARNNLAAALVQQEKFGEAAEHLRRALEISPASAQLRANLGRALAGQGDIDGAIGEWRRAVQANPLFAGAHNDLGTGLFRKGRLEDAIAAFRKAIEIDPAFVQARHNLDRALAQKAAQKR
ncbi:MAG TPA: tetratricopeptide repeat protein [Bryobacteraceae bacterium]|nr:tetratricopeptide repeat protein [Bryobacteraceae bacterium]